MPKPGFVAIHQVDVEVFHRLSENFNPLEVAEEKGTNEVIRIHPWAPRTSVSNFMAIYPKVVETFHYEPKTSTCWWH